MPSDLHAKLDYILKSNAAVQVGFDEFSLKDYDKLIPAIDQAFADEGYRQTTTFSFSDTIMTGQEWYDRFIREFNYAVHLKGDTKLTSKGVVQCVESAAKRASGLEGDTHAR